MATVKVYALTEGGCAEGARAHNETENQVNQEHLEVEESDFSHPLSYLLGPMNRHRVWHNPSQRQASI